MATATFRPQSGRGMPKRTNTRTSAPNPFLEGFTLEDGSIDTAGTILDSYQLKMAGKKADFEVEVPGKWEAGIITKGPHTGEPTERLVGEASKVEAQIRRAADATMVPDPETGQLGPAGVSIVILASRRKGHVIIQYEAKKRSNYGPQTTNAETPEA